MEPMSTSLMEHNKYTMGVIIDYQKFYIKGFIF